MTEHQLLLFDASLLAFVAALCVPIVGFAISLVRGSDRRGLLPAVAGLLGLVLVLGRWMSDLVSAVTGAHFTGYPPQPARYLAVGLVVSAVVMVAAMDALGLRLDRLFARAPRRAVVARTIATLLVAVTGFAVLSYMDRGFRAAPAAAGVLALEPTGDSPDGAPTLSLVPVANAGLLNFPMFLTSPPGDERLFVLERSGGVVMMERDGSDLSLVLDLSDLVPIVGFSGAQGMAFHPDFAQNGRFFLFTADEISKTVLEFNLNPVTGRVEPRMPIEILRIPAEGKSAHSGGMLQFGPDGLLYVSVGDGPFSESPTDKAQDLDNFLGTILRIDVDRGAPFVVPAENEFDTDRGPMATVFYGLRNPFRFWIDDESRTMIIGDVGQHTREELNLVSLDTPGVNLGWSIMEGSACFGGKPVSECRSEGLHLPVLEYTHDAGCSVVAGPKYSGEIEALGDAYLYGDYCSGWLRSFRIDGVGAAVEVGEWEPDTPGTLAGLISFGVDSEGDVYLLLTNGAVYRLAA